jgi:hypothetical protein
MIRILNKKDNKQLSELIKIALIENIFIVKKKNHHFSFFLYIFGGIIGIVVFKIVFSWIIKNTDLVF